MSFSSGRSWSVNSLSGSSSGNAYEGLGASSTSMSGSMTCFTFLFFVVVGSFFCGSTATSPSTSPSGSSSSSTTSSSAWIGSLSISSTASYNDRGGATSSSSSSVSVSESAASNKALNKELPYLGCSSVSGCDCSSPSTISSTCSSTWSSLILVLVDQGLLVVVVRVALVEHLLVRWLAVIAAGQSA